MPLTLIPLTLHDHTDLLQAVYEAAPGYWRGFGLDAAPEFQAIHTLRAANDTPGRTLFGILHPVNGSDQSSVTRGKSDPLMTDDSSLITEMIGVIDIHMHAPEQGVTTVGLIMVAEPWQRQGQGSAAWALVEAWLAGSAGMTKVRIALEAFNLGALRFFRAQGFTVLPEATRTQVGDHLVRQIFAEKVLQHREE